MDHDITLRSDGAPQLSRALALSGDTVKAKGGVYNDLLTLWKNADPDIRVLAQAQAEYARLP